MRTAVILAPDERGMLTAFGIPSVRRLAIVASKAGIERIFVIGKVDSLIPILSDLVPLRNFYAVESVDMLGQEIERLDIDGREGILVMRADYVVDRRSLTHFLETAEEPGISFMKAGGHGNGDGLYLTSPADLAPLLRMLWVGGKSNPEIMSRARRIQSPNGLPYVPESGIEGGRASEDRLVAALAAHTNPDDGLMARHLNRRISRFISRRLACTDISPNQITLVGMSTGLFGAFCLSRAGYGIQLFGSLLFVLCIIIDGVDGEVARLKLRESLFGHYLDVTTDNIVHAAVFVGIAFGLYHNTGDPGYIRALWFMMGGLLLCLISVYQCILRLSPDEREQSPRVVRIMALMSNRDFAYLVAALALIGRLNWFLLGSVIGSYVFAIGLWTISFHEKRRRLRDMQ
ncbi:MAG: CDP-alcohol phosphatidyltransferase family protein [Syntrophobacteraceae bacterium]